MVDQLSVGSFKSGPLKFIDTVFLTHAAGLFSVHVQFDGIEEGVLSALFNIPDNEQYVTGVNRQSGP